MTIEHRLDQRLISYWNGLRKETAMPDFAQFNASAIADIWQQCILFTVAPGVESQPAVLNFYQIGDKLRELYGTNLIGRSFNTSQRHFQGIAIVRQVEQMLADPAPINDVGQFINEKSKIVKYRSCILPFGRGGKVTHIITGVSWREY